MRPVFDTAVIKNSFKLTLWVPRESVGLVIGKKGVMVTKICKETHTRMQINPTEVEEQEDSLWVPISVMGEPNNAQAAYERIRSLVEEMDDAVAEFQVLKTRLHRIVGKKGETIRKISADTSVRIFVPELREETAENNPQECVTLEGDADDVFEAFQRIVDVTSMKPFARESNGHATCEKTQAKEKEKEKKEENQNSDAADVVDQAEDANIQRLQHEGTKKAAVEEQPREQDEEQVKGKQRAEKQQTRKEGQPTPQTLVQRLADEGDHEDARPSRRKREVASETSSEADDQEGQEEHDVENVQAMNSEQEDVEQDTANDNHAASKATKAPFVEASREIALPPNIVRLLLTKRANFPIFMHKLEATTRTRIWRNPSTQAQPTDDASQSKGEDEPAEVETAPVPDSPPKSPDGEPVMFTIRGRTEQAVDEAFDILQRIVAGERIGDVLPKRQTPAASGQQPSANFDRQNAKPKKPFYRKRDTPREKA